MQTRVFHNSSLLICAALLCLPACMEDGIELVQPEQDTAEVVQELDGPSLYAKYCGLCHGDVGEGYKADQANALNNPEFLSIASDDFLRDSIVKGRPGTPMSAWGESYGGPLSDGDVSRLVYHMRKWQTEPDVDVSSITVEGKIDRGELIYSVHCKDCHGAEGSGGTHMTLNNPEFLAIASDGFLRHSISEGRSNTVMKAYGDVFTPQQLDDLVVLIRSWQVAPSARPTAMPVIDEDNVVLNPEGPDPIFTEGRFISAGELKAALDQEASLIIIDARPPSDYLLGHIAGAISVPFYDVESALGFLPEDVWIVAYCACPHAESTAAADALEDNGYTQVKVLDEGYLFWLEQALPVHTGANP